MDVFSHALWTNIAFYKKYKEQKRQRFLAVLFGILPDLISFTPLVIYLLFAGRRFLPIPAPHTGPWMWDWALGSYNYTHSLIIFFVVYLIIYFWRKRVHYWPLWAWALHIVMDIFTHKEFYRTPFLFPISSYQFPYGFSWAESWFMVTNATALAVVYLFIFFWKRRKNLSPFQGEVR